MALAVKTVDRSVIGNRRVFTGTITFDDSYPVGGEIFGKDQIGFDVVFSAIFSGPVNAEYDRVNKKVKAFVPSTGAEYGDGDTDLENIVLNFEITGV